MNIKIVQIIKNQNNLKVQLAYYIFNNFKVIPSKIISNWKLIYKLILDFLY